MRAIDSMVSYHAKRLQSNNWQIDSEEEDERMENMGFTNDELNMLLCQGVKPWDDEAWDVLEALHEF